MELIHSVYGEICSKRITGVCYLIFILLHAEAWVRYERKLVAGMGAKRWRKKNGSDTGLKVL
jgi:hypothetical protein